MTRPTYNSVHVDGLDVFYREAGNPAASTLLLLHGFPTSSHMFRDLIPLLSDRFHMVAPDLPGFRNIALYPDFQAYFRKHRPPFLAVWGRNDPFFLPAGAEVYKRDLPEAEVQFLDTGHFALETHASEIAEAIGEFLKRQRHEEQDENRSHPRRAAI